MPCSQSHFLIKWFGNKRLDFPFIYKHLPLDNKINIIEPFCGSCAISFGLWLEYGDRFNYYLNDIDEDLIKFINYQKNEDLDNLILKFNHEKKQYNSKDEFKILYNSWLEDKCPFKYFILSRLSMFGLNTLHIYETNTGKKKNKLFESTSKINKKHRVFQRFLRSPNVFISNNDWYDCYNKYKDDTNSLILFDPPYIDSTNITYKKNSNLLNIYDKLNEIKNDKASCIFIIEKIDKIKELFKDWNILTEYDKIYAVKQRKTKHIVYSN